MASSEVRFAVLAEKRGHPSPLYAHNLTFERLFEDVIIPCEAEKSFRIDGVSLTQDEVIRIKVVRQTEHFDREFINIHHFVRASKSSTKRITPEEYPVRMEALFRDGGPDVTTSVMNAFDTKVRPSLKGLTPEVIASAFKFFSEALSRLPPPS